MVNKASRQASVTAGASNKTLLHTRYGHSHKTTVKLGQHTGSENAMLETHVEKLQKGRMIAKMQDRENSEDIELIHLLYVNALGELSR